MANETNNSKLTTFGQLMSTASEVNKYFAKKQVVQNLQDEVTQLQLQGGGEVNKIDSITVNGREQTPVDKKVNLTIPEKITDLEDDSEFQKAADVSSAIETALGQKGYLPESELVTKLAENGVVTEEDFDDVIQESDYLKAELAKLATKPEEGSEYVTDKELEEKLDGYATKPEDDEYVTESSLEETLSSYAEAPGEGESYVKQSALESTLQGYAPKGDYATKDQLTGLLNAETLETALAASEYLDGELDKKADATALDGKLDSVTINGHTLSATGETSVTLTMEDVDSEDAYLKKGDLGTQVEALGKYAEKATDGSGYVSNNELTAKLDGYVEDEDIADLLDATTLEGALESSDYLRTELAKKLDEAAVKGLITDANHASYQIVDNLPDPSNAQKNVMYLLKKAGKKGYDIYVLVDEDSEPKLEWVDDTTADLEGYATTQYVNDELAKKVNAPSDGAHYVTDTDLSEQLDAYVTTTSLNETLAGYVEDPGDDSFVKQSEIANVVTYDNLDTKLQSSSYLSGQLGTKLDESAATTLIKSKVVVDGSKDGTITIDGEKKTVYTLPDTVVHKSDIASDEEVLAMLEEIFGSDAAQASTLEATVFMPGVTLPNGKTVASDKEVNDAVQEIFQDDTE